jgi:soluble lytic murein transglycosylase-like protein
MKYDGRDTIQRQLLQRTRARLAAQASRLGLGFLGDAGSIPDLIQSIASGTDVPPALALQVATQESSLNPDAVSNKGAQGLFQLMPATSAQLGVTNPFDPSQNTLAGLTYLQELYQQFGDWATALTAYNWGPGNVAKYGAAAAPASTQNYVATALAAAGPSASASPGAAAPYDPSQDTGPIIDLPGLDPLTDSTPAPVSPNLILLAAAALAVYLANDLIWRD